MKHFFTTRVRVVLIAAALLAAGLALISSLLGKTLPDMLVQSVLTPLRAGASVLTDRAERLYDYVFRYEALEAENAALKEQLAEMAEDSRRADAVQRENDRLKDLLELKKTQDTYRLVDAYIISWNSNDWTSTFTVNRGSSSGIEKGMCAITANGEVVGLVIEVGPNYSVIKTVLDSSLRISATISNSGNGGIVQGAYAKEQAGLLRMDYLDSGAIPRIGDQVVTAGSTVYPRGLVLGKVVDAGYEGTGVAMFALVEPAADISGLEQIFILTEFSME